VDTGFGLLDLKKLAGELCPGKELVVVNTHAHGDHNSGNGQFDRVFCGRMDEPSNRLPMDEAMRARFAEGFLTDNPLAAGADAAAWRPQPAGRTLPLADGDVIDLGGTRLTVLETPGHTIGSICLWDRDAGLLFTGDLALTWECGGSLNAPARSSITPRACGGWRG
jgi:glyoxylase-like metal-dependent hydrolase (beta-lactamase superfamily II)